MCKSLGRILAIYIVTIAALSSPAAAATRLVPSTDLKVLHSRHYRLHTDLDRPLAEDLARRMDAMYEEYARRLATFDVNRSGDRFDVYLFAKRKNYLDFTGNQLSNAGGVTIPELNVVAAYLEEQGRDSLRQTMQHEAFHQFATSVISRDLPPWLNEGLAVMFQEGIWTGRSFMLGQVPPRRVRQLQQDIASNRIVDFRTMMKMSLNDWNATLDRNRVLGSAQYNQAWAMCQFLVYASDGNRPKYRARFLDLLQRIHAGVEPMEAFKQSFSANIDGFQVKFMEWAKSLSATPEATMIERQNILADMLTKFKQDGEHFDDVPDFRQTLAKGGFQMQYTAGDVKWVTDADPRVYFRTLDGRSFNHDEMFFDTRSGAPLADLVCSPVNHIHLRTRFYDLPKGIIEHETLVEGGGNGR